MIKDCLDGKIDRIITKSVSRFARNTRDSLKYVRLLKEKGIGVYFETESLFTLDANSDFPLTILSSIAEQGSRTMSSSIKWGFQKRFTEGRLMMSTKNF